MAKGFDPSSEFPGEPSVMLAKRSFDRAAKVRFNIYIEAVTRQLIDDAAAIQGMTRTEFVIESARRSAINVLLDRRLFGLGTDHYDRFLTALNNSPAPGPKLRALIRRNPARER